MFLSGSDILVKTLIEQGCDTVFGYPGGQILNVYDSLYTHQDKITHILTAHEQAIHFRNTGSIEAAEIQCSQGRTVFEHQTHTLDFGSIEASEIQCT